MVDSRHWQHKNGLWVRLTELHDDKPTLLCIHGFPTHADDWLPLWPSLAEHFNLIAPDLLGFGRSAKPYPHRYTIDQQARLCWQLVDSMALSSVHILAHDYGDSVAQAMMHLAHRRGLQINSVVFLNGGLFPESHRPRLIQTLLKGLLGPLLIKGMSSKSFEKNLRAICTQPLSDDFIAHSWQLLQAQNGLRVVPGLLGYLNERKRRRADWVGAMQQANYPMCFINGVDDPISGLHMLERYQQLIPEPDVVALADTGHYPQVESPQETLQALLEFWRKHNVILANTRQ